MNKRCPHISSIQYNYVHSKFCPCEYQIWMWSKWHCSARDVHCSQHYGFGQRHASLHYSNITSSQECPESRLYFVSDNAQPKFYNWCNYAGYAGNLRLARHRSISHSVCMVFQQYLHVQTPLMVRVDHYIAPLALLSHVSPRVATLPLVVTAGTLELAKHPTFALVRCLKCKLPHYESPKSDHCYGLAQGSFQAVVWWILSTETLWRPLYLPLASYHPVSQYASSNCVTFHVISLTIA